MKNFRMFMTMFVVIGGLITIFGTLMYRAFVNSVRFYGYQPSDLKILIVTLVIFGTGVGVSGYLLTKALDWLILVRRFRREFGFNPPDDPLRAAYLPEGDRRAVQARLASIHRYNSVKKYVDTTLLAEKFGFLVNWPVEYREQYARTHR